MIFFIPLFYVDRRQSSINATTTIVTVSLGSDDVQGKICLEEMFFPSLFLHKNICQKLNPMDSNVSLFGPVGFGGIAVFLLCLSLCSCYLILAF